MLAVLAPVVMAVVLWLVTRSPYSLLFAALGPVLAVAQLADGRRHTRRVHRAATAEYERELERVGHEIERRHEEELLDRRAALPPVSLLLEGGVADPTRWRRAGPGADVVALARGEVASALRVSGEERSEEAIALRARARVLRDAPIAAHVRETIGVLGPRVLARAVARGYLLQLTHALAPGQFAITALPPGWEWAERLPHRRDAVDRGSAALGSAALALRIVEAGAAVGDAAAPGSAADPALATIAIASSAERLPPGCGAIVELLRADRARLTLADRPGDPAEVRVELVSERQARAHGGVLAEHARALGIGSDAGALPRRVSLEQLLAQSPVAEPSAGNGGHERPRLDAVVGVTASGPLLLDLVAQGPHAVVGGTTGSGKSELLLSWVLALASRHAPDELTVLLVDFKGGATFAPLAGLPHCVGVVTDLDGALAERAVSSLRAELRYREAVLAELGARSIDAPAARTRLARLVIVVDEYQAMTAAFPELGELFTDLGARGRSLGIHLVLGTQRPGSAVRDGLLANCELRLSLRVNNSADSVAVVGTDAAARLSGSAPGRCVVRAAGAEPLEAQIATAGDGLVASLVSAASAQAGAPVRRPWLDPLPTELEWSDPRLAVALAAALSSGSADGMTGDEEHALVLGIDDRPHEQRQDVALYRPRHDGHLMVVGAEGSGVSTLVAALCAQSSPARPVERLPVGLEGAWDRIHELAADTGRPSHASRPPGTEELRVVIVDGLDALLAAYEEEHRLAFVETLGRCLRAGAGGGIRFVLTARTIPSELGRLRSLLGSTLLLRTASREDHVAAGGEPRGHDPAAPPGRARWHGREVQIVRDPEGAGARPERRGDPHRVAVEPGRILLVVAAAPTRLADELRTCHPQAHLVRIGVDEIDLPGSPQLAEPAADAGEPPLVLIADPEGWQAQWPLLSRMKGRATMVFDGCSLAEVRSITRKRELPPPLDGEGRVWLLEPEGRMRRGRWA